MTDALAPLFRRVSRIHNAQLEEFGLRAVDAHILLTLWKDGPLQVREVRAALGIQGSTLTGALDRLEKRELLRREPDPGDRRAYRLVAAKLGKRRQEQMEGALRRAEEQCYGSLTRAEQAELLRLVTKVNRALAQEE